MGAGSTAEPRVLGCSALAASGLGERLRLAMYGQSLGGSQEKLMLKEFPPKQGLTVNLAQRATSRALISYADSIL